MRLCGGPGKRILALLLIWGGPGTRAAHGAGESDPIALVWTAPTSCPTADFVHDEMMRTLGATTKDLAPVAAVVTVSQGVGRWQANLTLHAHGQRAEREYGAESCEALASATALIVALAAEGRDQAQPAPESVPPSSGPHRDRETPILPAESAPVWTSSSYLLQLNATFDDGTLPYAYAPGIEAGAGKSWKASVWRLRALGTGSYFVTQSGTSPYGASGDLGNYWLLTFAARACATVGLGRLELGPCFGGEFAVIHGTDVGDTRGSDSQYWLSLLGGLMAELELAPRVSLVARTDLAFPTTQRTVNGASSLPGSVDAVYNIPPHAIRIAAGLELHFF